MENVLPKGLTQLRSVNVGILILWTTLSVAQASDPYPLHRTTDFEISGDGTSKQWDLTTWEQMTKLDHGGENYTTKFKVLASETGLYVLFHGEDNTITTSDYQNMDKLWNGDVYELFIHTQDQDDQYFEYEVSPMGRQLALTISASHQGMPWIPFNEYGEDAYGLDAKVGIQGGPTKIGGKIDSWYAEVFISYKSLGLLSKVPPKKGTEWFVNFCRLDHDTGKMIKWSWTPTIVESLHELDKFRTVRFE